MSEPVVLKSTLFGNLMNILFGVSLGVAAVLLALALSMLFTGDTTGGSMAAGMFLLSLFGLGLLPLMVFTIIWVVIFHRDLKAVFPDYPMSPLRAVLYMFIPFFNLFGLWRTFASISEYLRASGGQAGQLGDKANLWSTLGYMSLIVFNLAYVFIKDASHIQGVGQGMAPQVFLALCLATTAFVVCYLNSIRFSQKSLALVALKGVALDTREVLTYVR